MWRENLSNPSLVALVGELRCALQGCRTVLDIGCGTYSPMRFLSNVHVVGFDGYPLSLKEARRNKTHDEYVLGDVKMDSRYFFICMYVWLEKYFSCGDYKRRVSS